MGTDDSSLLKGIIDFDHVAKADMGRKLRDYEFFGTPINPNDLISGITDPNSMIDQYYRDMLFASADSDTRSHNNIKIRYVYRLDDSPKYPTAYFPLYLVHPYDYVNPEIYKVAYPLPDELQKKVDDFVNLMISNPRSLLWNQNQTGTSQKKQLPKSKKQLRKNEKSAKNPEEPGSENTLGIPRIKLSASLLA